MKYIAAFIAVMVIAVTMGALFECVRRSPDVVYPGESITITNGTSEMVYVGISSAAQCAQEVVEKETIICICEKDPAINWQAFTIQAAADSGCKCTHSVTTSKYNTRRPL